jgi:hypothetical protein
MALDAYLFGVLTASIIAEIAGAAKAAKKGIKPPRVSSTAVRRSVRTFPEERTKRLTDCRWSADNLLPLNNGRFLLHSHSDFKNWGLAVCTILTLALGVAPFNFLSCLSIFLTFAMRFF